VLPENGDGQRSVAAAVAGFLEETELTKKPKTLAAYATALNYFTSCRKLYVHEIDRHDLLKFSAFLRDEKEQSPRSVYNKFETVMTFLMTMTGRLATTLPLLSPVLVVRQHPKEPRRDLSLVRWGLIPSWAKDASGSAAMINARSESAATKPAFRDALKSRRCLIPADEFYEWMRAGKTKQPYCFEVNDGELFAFAGLWERWKEPSGNWIKTYSILTTTPNAVTAEVHDRMPVILHPANFDLWLDPGFTNVTAVSAMLKPDDERLMRCFPVSARINQVQNDDAEYAKPVEIEALSQSRLSDR
jgi:putative SOS response-associated peptidase YedK